MSRIFLSGLICVAMSVVGCAEPPLGEGESCGPSDVCDTGLVCIGNIHGPCDSPFCGPATKRGRCQLPRGTGGPCFEGSNCRDDLSCRAAGTGTSEAGSSCSCRSNATCSPGHRCLEERAEWACTCESDGDCGRDERCMPSYPTGDHSRCKWSRIEPRVD